MTQSDAVRTTTAAPIRLVSDAVEAVDVRQALHSVPTMANAWVSHQCHTRSHQNADVNECTSNVHQCHTATGAKCVNFVGDYVCECPSGYRLRTGNTCVDIDECHEWAPCAEHGGRCENTVGSYKCTCNSGFTGDGYVCVRESRELCKPATNTTEAQCAHRQQCTVDRRTGAARACDAECAHGYAFDDRAQSCIDVDECTVMRNSCAAHADCVNTAGSYTCACRPGYEGDGRQCEDINECAADKHACHAQAQCTNLPGSYTCACPAGWAGNATVSCLQESRPICTDAAVCTTNADCLTLADVSTAVCECRRGYRRESLSGKCVDIDECAENRHECSTQAECANSAGSYACTCRRGYTGDGRHCMDVDECAVDHGGCAPTALCVNTAGGNLCVCASGYTGDGLVCNKGATFIHITLNAPIAASNATSAGGRGECPPAWRELCAKQQRRTCVADAYGQSPACDECLYGHVIGADGVCHREFACSHFARTQIPFSATGQLVIVCRSVEEQLFTASRLLRHGARQVPVLLPVRLRRRRPTV